MPSEKGAGHAHKEKVGGNVLAPQYYGCGPINISHILFLMFYGFCAYTNTDRLAPPPLGIASYASEGAGGSSIWEHYDL